MDLREQVSVFSQLLLKYLGEDLISVVLFGSVARGDFTIRSDIDLLLVIDNLAAGRELQRDIIYTFLSHRALETFYTLLSHLGYASLANDESCPPKKSPVKKELEVMRRRTQDAAAVEKTLAAINVQLNYRTAYLYRFFNYNGIQRWVG